MKISWTDALDEQPWSDALRDEAASVAFDWLPGRFCMFYQPDLDLRSGAMGACEALLRWWHPEYGMLRPDASLRGTKWTERISEIETWAMEMVFRQASVWSDEGLGVQVAVNVSAPFLESDELLLAIDRLLGATDVDPELLAIDIPIGALAMEPLALAAVTDAIVARGISIFIDGVGESAGHYAFERVDASAWKIDLWAQARRRPGIHPSVRAALTRAQHAGVLTIAKSVEDERTLQGVRDMGFDRAFGHVVSPAVTTAAMSALLRRPRDHPFGPPAQP